MGSTFSNLIVPRIYKYENVHFEVTGATKLFSTFNHSGAFTVTNIYYKTKNIDATGVVGDITINFGFSLPSYNDILESFVISGFNEIALNVSYAIFILMCLTGLVEVRIPVTEIPPSTDVYFNVTTASINVNLLLVDIYVEGFYENDFAH